MILADTSVWVEHFRKGLPAFAALLEQGRISCHPLVIGELACGTLSPRAEVLTLLKSLPSVTAAADAETLLFIERRSLHGRGIGFVDAHLLAASELSGARLWTRDKPLLRLAERLRIAYHPSARLS